jgi:hypothetical protein
MNQWSSLEVAKLIASLGTPIVVALIGFWISRVVRKQERQLDEAQRDKKTKQDAEAKAADDERFRLTVPHVELSLDCQFHGVRAGQHLVTVTVSAVNVGQILHQFTSITLRVRGIKDEPFVFDDKDGRVLFPHKLLQRDLVPEQWNFVFIEPRVTQKLPLTFPVADDYSYLLADVAFEYKEYWPHSGRAVFEVPK